MKKIGVLALAAGVIFIVSGLAMADRWKNESGKGPPGKPGFDHRDRDHRGGHDNRGRYDDRGYDDRDWRRDYRDHRGYRERPYDRGRHYGHYKHKGHRYEYRGHWRSWDAWDRYARRHPHVYKHGRYYRDNAHLMFRFCEPGSGACFFFSIGR